MRTLTLSCLLFLISAAAHAGDFAQRVILGFSTDGGRFAFEEFGIQDGSGFAYSNIFVIATADDSWVPGSPVRVRLDDENATLADARNGARKQAAALLQPVTEPGFIAATNQPTEITDTENMAARPRIFYSKSDKFVKASLSQFPLPGPDFCPPDFGNTFGFRLTLQTRDGPTVTLNNDAKLPTSRGCPLNYSLADIVTYYPPAGQPVLAVLILMRKIGFEGPDGRYLAVTTSFDG